MVIIYKSKSPLLLSWIFSILLVLDPCKRTVTKIRCDKRNINNSKDIGFQ